MPAITQLTRYKGGNHDQMVEAAKKAKGLYEKYGAEFFRLSRFHTGSFAGEWLAVSRYSSWEVYGKAMEGLSKDKEFQKLLAHVLSMAEMTARNVTVGIV